MSLNSREFFVAAVKVAKKKTIRIKKEEKKQTLTFTIEDSSSDLKKSLEQSEKLYNEMKGELTKKQLEKISTQIKTLKSKLNAKQEHIEEAIEFEDQLITTPILEELYQDLDELDIHYEIPKRR